MRTILSALMSLLSTGGRLVGCTLPRILAAACVAVALIAAIRCITQLV